MSSCFVFDSGVVKRAYTATFKEAAMSRYVQRFSYRYEAIRLPTEFPRKARTVSEKPDWKASEWRNLVIIAFTVFDGVFDAQTEGNSRRSSWIADLRHFWLLTVSAIPVLAK